MAKILHRFYDLCSGGAEVVILNIVTTLANHDHVLVFNRFDPSWLSTRLMALPNVRLVQLSDQPPGLLFATEDPDLLLFHYYPPMSIRDFTQVPSSLRGRVFVYNHWFTPMPYAEDIKGYCFPSPSSLATAGTGIPSDKKTFIQNPVADKFFKVARQRDNQFRVGRHSRDSPKKFSADAFELFEGAAVRGMQVLMLGHTDEMGAWLARHSDRLRHIYWLLRKNTIDVARFLSFLDVYVYRTHEAFVETSPLVILEAMASSLPVVAEAKGGIVDFIRHGTTGFLCDSLEDYCRAIEVLAADPELRCSCGVAAREWAWEHASVNRFGRDLSRWLALC